MIVLNAADTIAGVASAATEVTCTIAGMTLNAGVETYDVLDQRQLAAAVATIYTVPSSTQAFIKSIHVVNNGAVARTFQLFVNGTAAANAITPAVTLQIGGWAVYGENGWQIYTSNGSMQTGIIGALLNVQNILQGTTTYTPTAGTTRIMIEMVGGGGGGGGVLDANTNAAAAGGGGASAYASKYLALTKSSYACVVGAGGAGGAAGANNGSPGTDSTFDSPSICTADGGAGGISSTVTTAGPLFGGEGGAGGLIANSVGDVRSDGMPGETGLIFTAAIARSGMGGTSYFGGGAIGRKTQGDGIAAALYGSGGSGGCNLSSAASQAGGNGSNGLIRIWEYA